MDLSFIQFCKYCEMCDRTHRTHGPVGYVTLPGTHFLKKSAFMYYAVTVVGVF